MGFDDFFSTCSPVSLLSTICFLASVALISNQFGQESAFAESERKLKFELGGDRRTWFLIVLNFKLYVILTINSFIYELGFLGLLW